MDHRHPRPYNYSQWTEPYHVQFVPYYPRDRSNPVGQFCEGFTFYPPPFGAPADAGWTASGGTRDIPSDTNTSNQDRRVSTASTDNRNQLDRPVTMPCRAASTRAVSIDFALQELKRQLEEAEELCNKYLDQHREAVERIEFAEGASRKAIWTDLLKSSFKKDGEKDRFLNMAHKINKSMQQTTEAMTNDSSPSTLGNDDADERRHKASRNARTIKKLSLCCSDIGKLASESLHDVRACEDMVEELKLAVRTVGGGQETEE